MKYGTEILIEHAENMKSEFCLNKETIQNTFIPIL